jgi:translation initiation factor 5B
MEKIRQPIVTVAGHVDHGKTSILDCFRGSSIQEGEAGGITQKISFTKYPLAQIHNACPLIKKSGVGMDMPGFLFIDTPGHSAFTNLRKRGGSLADLAILVVSIKDGIKPQTAEVIQILKANKTPFLIALNKIDSISGWTSHKEEGIKKSIDLQAMHVRQEFDECLMLFQGALSEHGFEADLFFDVNDFTKKIAIVPCSARTKEGINELLFVLCGLCQRFLKERLKLNDDAKGVILEIKKDRNIKYAEAIIYDGSLDVGDQLVIANFDEPIISKVRVLEEVLPLSRKYACAQSVTAASGVRMQLTESDNVLPGMPFEEFKDETEKEKIKAQFKKELSGALKFDNHGIIIKADSLGSLEALMTLLRQERVQILKAGIGPIGKIDVISAKANLEINPLDAIILGFNVDIEEDIQTEGIKIMRNEVVYRLIEELQIWRKNRQNEIEKERLMGLAGIVKLEILHKYVFRNSNPSIFGVKVVGGKVRTNMPLMDNNGESIARVKGLQLDKNSVEEANENQEIAISLPGVTFDRQLKEIKYLYSELSEKQISTLRKNEDLLSPNEKGILHEIESLKDK